MCNNGSWGNNCWWIIILILLFCNCGNGLCGNFDSRSGCGCGCDNDRCGCC